MTGEPSGHLRIEEEAEPPFDWRSYGPEDWPAFALFWALTIIVFLQFFTRYVLNDSLAWTEEAARYFLIGVTFLGCGMVGRRRAHIAVEYLHTKVPPGVSRIMMIVVDAITATFFGYCAWVTWRMIGVMGAQKMAVIELSMAWLYWVVFAGLAIMTLRGLHSLLRRIMGDSPPPSII
jgi:TRAP-type C4-dicarboxylate transport system permease small subunit